MLYWATAVGQDKTYRDCIQLYDTRYLVGRPSRPKYRVVATMGVLNVNSQGKTCSACYGVTPITCSTVRKEAAHDILFMCAVACLDVLYVTIIYICSHNIYVAICSMYRLQQRLLYVSRDNTTETNLLHSGIMVWSRPLGPTLLLNRPAER